MLKLIPKCMEIYSSGVYSLTAGWCSNVLTNSMSDLLAWALTVLELCSLCICQQSQVYLPHIFNFSFLYSLDNNRCTYLMFLNFLDSQKNSATLSKDDTC